MRPESCPVQSWPDKSKVQPIQSILYEYAPAPRSHRRLRQNGELAPPDRSGKVDTGFPRDKREAYCAEIMLKQRSDRRSDLTNRIMIHLMTRCGITEALVPPKPNELDKATLISRLRGVCGTQIDRCLHRRVVEIDRRWGDVIANRQDAEDRLDQRQRRRADVRSTTSSTTSRLSRPRCRATARPRRVRSRRRPASRCRAALMWSISDGVMPARASTQPTCCGNRRFRPVRAR